MWVFITNKVPREGFKILSLREAGDEVRLYSMASQGSRQVLENFNGPEADEGMERSRSESQKSVAKMDETSSTCLSTSITDRSEQSNRHRTAKPTCSMANTSKDSVGEDLKSLETSEDTSLQYNSHRQEQDLLGLILQPANERILDDYLRLWKAYMESKSHMQDPACSQHKVFCAWLQDTADPPPKVDHEMALLPMERYLVEGLTERYALFSVSQPATDGEWARYSACPGGHDKSGL